MNKLNQWVAIPAQRLGPAFAAFALVALSILLTACGGGNSGGGSSY